MSAELSKQTIGQMVAERPSRSRVFECWGIDYCCGGKKRLEDSCAALSIDFEAVQRDLQREGAVTEGCQTDWTTAPLTMLSKHIVTTHHAYLRDALPRLSFLTQKVRDAHSSRHPELAELADTFTAFREGMEAHAQKEELVLFPAIERLERKETATSLDCGSISHAIQVMESEHEEAGEGLKTMRSLTNGYAVPDGACATYRAMLDALSELEEDTHRHVHKENSILFPRAEALEREQKCEVTWICL